MKQKKINTLIITALIAVIGGLALLAAKTENHNSQVSRQFDIFHSLFRELDLFYVDSVDTEETFRNAIDGLLADYDPYTEYIPADELEDFKYLTTGEYAGIGAIISRRGNRIFITEPYEGLPAQKTGLLFGDEILEIDGEPMEGKEVSYASDRLKGQPNTKVKLLIGREGEKKPLTFEITRQHILIDQVRYAGMVGPATGYIYLSGFTDKAYQEVREAALRLQGEGATSLVLDLRGNGGGLLTEAVNICNLFVDKGEMIVCTKGKVQKWDRYYKTMREPLFPDMPLAILTDNGSASSSEIVAGALQDLDRAVIVGTRTYGKGLVQTTRELPYDGILKVTTAKYYIPSGRCIQAIDYSNRNADGSVGRIPDSLTTTFKTRHERIVRDGGGIMPDLEIKTEEMSNLSYQLSVQSYLSDYADRYFRRHSKIAPASEFTLSDQDYEDFKQFVIDKDIKYDIYSLREMQTLKRYLEYEGYMDSVRVEFQAIENKLGRNLSHDLDFFRPEIARMLESEIALRYYYQKGQMQSALRKDECLKEALSILSDESLYKSLLNIEKQ